MAFGYARRRDEAIDAARDPGPEPSGEVDPLARFAYVETPEENQSETHRHGEHCACGLRGE